MLGCLKSTDVDFTVSVCNREGARQTDRHKDRQTRDHWDSQGGAAGLSRELNQRQSWTEGRDGVCSQLLRDFECWMSHCNVISAVKK